MNSPQLSPEERKQADALFKEAHKRAFIAIFAAAWAVAIVISLIARHAFHYEISPGWVCGLVIVILIPSHHYATRQVRKAGLSLDRTEIRVAHKTIQHFAGPTLVIRSDYTVTNGGWGVAITAFLALLLVWHQRSGHGFPPLGATCCCLVLATGFLQAAYLLSNPPLLRLDERGVFNGAQYLWPQRAAWAHIRKSELRQTFNYKGDVVETKLIFHTIKGHSVVVLFPKSYFPKSQPHEILEQVEAKLSGESKISGA